MPGMYPGPRMYAGAVVVPVAEKVTPLAAGTIAACPVAVIDPVPLNETPLDAGATSVGAVIEPVAEKLTPAEAGAIVVSAVTDPDPPNATPVDAGVIAAGATPTVGSECGVGSSGPGPGRNIGI